MKDEHIARPEACDLGRRDLVKIGAGAVVAAMQVQSAVARDLSTRPVSAIGTSPEGTTPAIGARSSGVVGARSFGNGPMDDTTRAELRRLGAVHVVVGCLAPGEVRIIEAAPAG